MQRHSQSARATGDISVIAMAALSMTICAHARGLFMLIYCWSAQEERVCFKSTPRAAQFVALFVDLEPNRSKIH
jgi:hypothetical protein